jgi:CheY-like chemotaxis protein
MKTPVTLLVTNDPILEDSMAQALVESGGLSHLTRNPVDALQLVSTIGQDLDFAVIDCAHGPYAMSLISAINARCEEFPVIAVTRDSEKQIEALAYANGARACLRKPVSAAQIGNVLKQYCQLHPQPALAA